MPIINFMPLSGINFSQAYEEYEIVANSYRYAFLQQRSLYFTLVDFDEGQDVFQSVGKSAMLHYSLSERIAIVSRSYLF